MRSSRQRNLAPGEDWFSWFLPTLLCLILIACLISFGLRATSHARAFQVLQDAPAASPTDPVRISSENVSSLWVPACTSIVNSHSFLQSDHDKASNEKWSLSAAMNILTSFQVRFPSPVSWMSGFTEPI